ncbi:MAG TPA: hypothetical protein EYP22_08715 [Methanosarcinales archaeon]|nr:hypothetical protein [Methanosarcinales archaeon]
MISLIDTCTVTYCFKGNILSNIQNSIFKHFLITFDILSEIQIRTPDALDILNYSIVPLNKKESEITRDIVDLVINLFGKDDLTPADASLIAVACNRDIPIYPDNTGIPWFFEEFLTKDYKKEPYKSAKNKIIEKIKYTPKIYTSLEVILEIYKENPDKLSVLANFTANSDLWFKKDDLDNLGIDWTKYEDLVFSIKQNPP